MRLIHTKEVFGKLVDSESRCVHWSSEKDIISIKFYCCNKYYPCYECHEEDSDHSAILWPKEKFDHKAVLCGNCGLEFSINKYQISKNQCPNCSTDFNPNCQLHWEKYFE